MLRNKLGKRVVVLITNLGLGLLLAISAFSFWSGRQYRKTNEWSKHSAEVVASLNELQIMVERAETAQRGFVITTDRGFLEPFYQARSELDADITHLFFLVSDNPKQTEKMHLLKNLIEQKTETLEVAIDLIEKNRPREAFEFVKAGKGRLQMDDIRAGFKAILDAETEILRSRTTQAESEFNRASWLVLAGLILAFSLLQFVTLKLSREITRRTLVEKELVRAEAKANEASTLKSQFLANMSHEIRTPLNGIIGMTKLLSETKLDSEQIDFLQTIRDSSNSLLSLINEILDLSKIESGKLQIEEVHFELRSLVQSTRSILEFAASARSISFIIEVADDLPDLYLGDPLRIRQILLNLLNNAIKFSDGGTVHLRVTKKRDEGSSVRIFFEVIDQGIGLNEEVKAKLFQAFTQGDESTSRRYGGTGLGLSIAKQLVNMMNGQIGVEENEGKGSRFYFDVLLKTAKYSDSQIAPRHEVDEAVNLGARVLVAEDNLINQKVASAMLKRMGCTVTIVADGGAAIDALKDQDFDLVLMDGQMPIIDGYEATRRIRSGDTGARNPRIPIIAVTANAIKGDLENCLSAGMNDYVSKPISQSDLMFKMQKWLSGGSKAIDPAEIEKLRSLSEDGSLLAEVIQIFRQTAPIAVADMNSAAKTRDFRQLSAQAHAFKSTCANLGATRLKDILSRLEKSRQEDDPQDIAALMTALETEYKVVTDELTIYEKSER